MKKDVIILHDVDGKIYFESVQKLKDENFLTSISYYETSVFKRFFKALLKKQDFKLEFFRFFKNLKFRFSMIFLKDNIIIFGSAPYDYRIILYSILAFRNKVYYHTSWPYWWGSKVPHYNFFYSEILKVIIKKVLNLNNFNYVCLTNEVSESFKLGLNYRNIEKVNIIPHCVDLSIFKNNQPLSADGDKIKILFVGRMIKEKGIYEICKIIDVLDSKKYHFTLVGDGEEGNSIQEIIKDYTNVDYLGHISSRYELSKIFKSHHIFLLPSKKTKYWEELFGLVIIEAMASGLLVIATSHIGPKGIITHEYDGILVSDNDAVVDQFVCEISKFSQRSLIRRNAIISSEKFDIQSIKENWRTIIESCI